MRILIITDGIYPYSMGGSHRLVYELARSLHMLGHTVTCIVPTIDKSSNFATEGSSQDLDGCRIVNVQIDRSNPISKFKSYFFGFLEPVRRELETGSYDVVNVHYLPALFSLRHLTRYYRIRYTFHGPWAAEFRLSFSGRMDSKPWVLRILSRLILEPLLYCIAFWIEHLILRRCDRFLVLSQYMRDILRLRYEVPDGCIRVVSGGVDNERFYPGRNADFRKKIAEGRSIVFVSIRRLEKRMGLDILLKACALLREKHKDFLLLIGGKGPHHAYLTSLLHQLKLEDNVKFLGFVPEHALRDYLSCADLFVLPSRDLEGFGLVVLESMASGTPVLVAPHGGPQEVVRQFESMYVLKELTPIELSDKLACLIASGALAQSREPAAIFASTYRWEKFALEFVRWAE